MSGSYTNTSGGSDLYNAGAAHDTGLYDPNRYDNQIVAVFENRTDADRARDALLGAGIPSSAIQVLDRSSGDQTAGMSRAEDRNQEGFWGAIKSLFAPEEDYATYHHAIERGHAMVVVVPTGDMDRHRAIEVLESSGPIDFDARLEEWRQAGYDRSGAPRSTEQDRREATASSGGTGTDYGRAAPIAGGTGAVADVSGIGGARAERTDLGTQATGAGVESGAVDRGNEGTVKVVEERLRVGKREVAKGAVRVRSYVVERPVEEQVRLHEESIQVERRPVDRPVEPSDELFQERTIEARATAEEAVVAKEARVVEEIGIRKEERDRTETVRDTVRETKVEVEDDRKDTPPRV